MASSDSGLRHISDTALMVAACRAIESRREGALVHDPFAERLAGTRGTEILRSLPRYEIMLFGIAIRSYFLDELVRIAVQQHGVRKVVCLGCGLDTRPWRLDLPADLEWIEADLPDLLQYKSGIMRGETPHCKLESVVTDLDDAGAREQLFQCRGDAPGLIITEGLLPYLAAGTVEGIARDAARFGWRYWILDATSPAFGRAVGMHRQTDILSLRAATALEGLEILDILHRHQYQFIEMRRYMTDVAKVAGPRLQAAAAARAQRAEEPPPPIPPDDPTGVHLLARG